MGKWPASCGAGIWGCRRWVEQGCQRRKERKALSWASPPDAHLMLTFTQEFASSPLLSVPSQPQDFQCPPVTSGLRYISDQVGLSPCWAPLPSNHLGAVSHHWSCCQVCSLETSDYPLRRRRVSQVAQWLRIHLPKQDMQEMWVQFLGQENPLEEGMATHSSSLAWRIRWTEELGGLQSVGSQRVGHSWACMHCTT